MAAQLSSSALTEDNIVYGDGDIDRNITDNDIDKNCLSFYGRSGSHLRISLLLSMRVFINQLA